MFYLIVGVWFLVCMIRCFRLPENQRPEWYREMRRG